MTREELENKMAVLLAKEALAGADLEGVLG